ncbi:hypothetical protein NQZ79_g8082 [Umbelopsis isabellina]|nr:hypothetical protein NQZ79_g8082 [Umbelopsis isabellina]
MMKGLVFPGILATLLSAQGAFAELFSAGYYAISPNINNVDYLGPAPYGNVSMSDQPFFWRVEPSDGEWIIYHPRAGYLGRAETYGPHSRVVISQQAQEWKIEQHEQREGTWRIVRPQPRDHPQYGDISVLTYHDSPEHHEVDVQHLDYVNRPNIIQYWRFTSVLQ